MHKLLMVGILAIVLIGAGAFIVLSDTDDSSVTVGSTPFGTVVCTPEEGGTVSIESYDYPNIAYEAVPETGYALSCWQDDTGTVLSTNTTITVNLTATTVINAVFVQVSEVDVTFTWDCPTSFSDEVTTESVSWTLTISSEDYSDSMATSTVHRHATTLVTTPSYMVSPEDEYVQAVATYLAGITEGYTDLEVATTILYFVQTEIPYETDSELYKVSEYWAYPMECLYNDAGDCEDTAVLFCSIAEAMGYDTALVAFSDHMGAAIVVDGVSGGQTYTDADTGVVYTYCETATDVAWGIGNITDTYASAAYTLVPIDYTATEASE